MNSPRRKKAEGQHVIPSIPTQGILDSFTLSNPISRRAIKDYVEIQTRGEKVQRLERVKTEHILERNYDCWDVHTNRNRYWVITSPTNFYHQKYFPSLDFTLSFHIGFTTRVLAAQRGAPDEIHKLRLNRVWRRWDEAAASYDSGEEVEDFQAVGMKCRECLIELVRQVSKPEMIPKGRDEPKRSDVLTWSQIIADSIAGGSNNDNIRSYLKTIIKSTWQLDNWLTHYRNATRFDADFALESTQSVLAAFGNAVIRYESKIPERCPKCGSYAIGVGYNPDLLPRPYVSECEKCGWQSNKMR